MGEHGEHGDYSLHKGAAALDIGEDVGALIIYTGAGLHGEEIEVSPQGEDGRRTHTAVLERRVNGGSVFAALFLALREGTYRIWRNDGDVAEVVTIVGGEVAQVDWRERPGG
ncbi:MAG TPA: hypothetical protein VH599_10055 [Ktedonobacterales bacterium]|jgi:hypothetical protein